MRRSLLILMAFLVAGAAVVFTAYQVTSRLCAARFASPADDLDWLRMEFHLGEAEMARIRQLHDGYLPTCRDFCERIAAKQHEVIAALGSGTNVTADVEQKLTEVGALRARCQAAMLRHFVEVSREMPPEQGRRYLAEMERLTLGSHEQIEQSMSGDAPAPHGHH